MSVYLGFRVLGDVALKGFLHNLQHALLLRAQTTRLRRAPHPAPPLDRTALGLCSLSPPALSFLRPVSVALPGVPAARAATYSHLELVAHRLKILWRAQEGLVGALCGSEGLRARALQCLHRQQHSVPDLLRARVDIWYGSK